MRLLHVAQHYPPAVGGAEKYIADLSEELVRRGHPVDVFTSRALDSYTWKNVPPHFERLNGVNIHRFRTLQPRAWVWEVSHFGLRNYARTRSRCYEPFFFLGGGPLAPGLLWAMISQVQRYDLVQFSCLVCSHVAYGYWVARRLGVRFARLGYEELTTMAHLLVSDQALRARFIAQQRERLQDFVPERTAARLWENLARLEVLPAPKEGSHV